MEWFQFRITFLISTFPGLIIAILQLADNKIELETFEKSITIGFTLLWFVVFILHLHLWGTK